MNVANRQKKITANHFLQEKVPRRTIYYIIQRYEESGAIVGKPRFGRPKKLTTDQLARLKRLMNNKTENELQRYSDKQLEEIPTRARRLYRLLAKNDSELIMDDEKYFMLHNESVPSNRGLYTSDPSIVSPEIKFRRTQKFEPKVLVWAAVPENSVSQLFFSKQKQARFHTKEKVLFWPDLATSHYSHTVMDHLDDNEVQMVHKEWNPQNCPQPRPIETLWSILSDMVYEGGWEAETIDQLKRRINKK
ncbi:unnamed protein product [Rotaria socialis]|uniref:Uncharacterized protein n=1 Tax=Rotaria socialis TaxID=392032 RepID=A0A821DGE8_9BILA|nr:unnamed protein product [Rotaria socialis]CAF4800372.1 unnamed protein product [Rotaria socialis]